MRLFLNIITILLLTRSAVGQELKQNNYKFNFYLTIKKNDSIPLYKESGELFNFLTQSQYDLIEPFITIDECNNGKMRIKLFDEVVINKSVEKYYETINTFDDFQVDSFNKTYDLLWIDAKYLKTDFSEWVFMEKHINPKKINQLYLYSKPSTKSSKKLLKARVWKPLNDYKTSTLYKIEILECLGQWAKINLTTSKHVLTGWMPWYNFCHNTLTDCHYLPEDGVINEE